MSEQQAPAQKAKVSGKTSVGTLTIEHEFNALQSNEEMLLKMSEEVNKNLVEVDENESQNFNGLDPKKKIEDAVTLDEEDSSIEIIEPEVPFSTYEKLVDMSQVLSTAIEAMKTNVYGFGWELIPLIDIKNEKGVKMYRDSGTPIEEEVLTAMNEEKDDIESFIENLSIDYSFEEITMLFGDNKERFGNAFFEWERDTDGQYIGMDLVPAKTMKLTKKEKKPILVEQKIRNKRTFSYTTRDRLKRFRRFVQVVGNKKLYFKEFGDPRVMNAITGKYLRQKNIFGDLVYILETEYEDIASNSPEAFPAGFVRAREIMHFKIYHPSGPYGKPRYLPSTPKILGSRAADLVNYNLLDNNTIPPLVVIVEGYQDDGIVERLEEYIKNKLKGKDSFSKILIIQAEAQVMGGAGPNVEALKPNIRIEPLSQMLTRDGMFLEYTNKSAEDIISSFRLTNMYVGMTKDINRATAQVAKEQVEEQVFTPAREEFNFIMNNKIFPTREVKYWKFKLKGGKLDDNELKSKIVEAFVRQGILLPSDGRRVAAKILDEIFEEVTDEFMNKPKDIAVAEIRSMGGIMSTLNEIDPMLTVDMGDEFNDDIQDEQLVTKGLTPDEITIAKSQFRQVRQLAFAKKKLGIKNAIYLAI